MSDTLDRLAGLKAIVIAVLIFACGTGIVTAGTGWREVLDRADSMVVSGEPDSADALVDDVLAERFASKSESESDA
ncbi:hypothetical protein ACFL2Z_03415, partial [Candidatus Eisenbacteria bacterium]